MVNLRSGHWLYKQQINTVANQSWYRIPPRAVAQGLELFCMTAPNSSSTHNWNQLAVLTNAESIDYQDQPSYGVPQFFTFESDGVVLFPAPADVRPLQWQFYLRPSALASVPAYSGVLVTPTSVSQLVVSCPDPNTLPWSAGSLIDIVNTNGSSEAIAIDVPVASVVDGTNVATVNLSTPLTSAQFAKLRTDQTQALVTAGTIWTIPLVVELHSALVSFTSAVILVDKGDAEKGAQLVSRCESAMSKILDVMQPRVKTRPWVLRTRNTYLRRRAGWQQSWR
jgi:hypothetical protein